MKLYTYFTESHIFLFENFLKKSVNFFNEYEIITGRGIQHSIDGTFNSKHFGKTTFEKLKFLIDSNEWNSNEIIIFSDVDVIFLNKTKEHFLKQMGDSDMIFQSDDNTCNTGFYLCRKNKNVRLFLETVLLKQNDFHNEQLALNSVINTFNINYKLFDYKVWNVKFQAMDPWDGETNIKFPDDILLYHANYMLGVKNKIKALNLVYNKFFNSYNSHNSSH